MFRPFRALATVALRVTLAVALAASAPAPAQGPYPSKPVRLVVPFPPGAGTDGVARYVAHKLSESMSQTVVIDNRTGAGTIVGTVAAANAQPDGYTLLAGLNANMAVNSALYATLAYDTIRDFTPVGMMAEFPFVIVVSKDFPAKSVKELIELAKAKPGEINVASAGNGSGQHLSLELFKMMTGVNMTHVPYRGAAPAYSDVISGRTPVFFDNLSSGLGQIKSGTVRALAVTGKERSALLPDVPTVAETVPGYQNYVWFGLWAPKKTPPAIVEKLHDELKKAVADPDIQKRIRQDAGVPMTTPLKDIEPMVKAEIAKWGDVVKKANIKIE